VVANSGTATTGTAEAAPGMAGDGMVAMAAAADGDVALVSVWVPWRSVERSRLPTTILLRQPTTRQGPTIRLPPTHRRRFTMHRMRRGIRIGDRSR
jgi:hypothetical protein